MSYNFRLPEVIRVSKELNGEVYWDHLFVDNSGSAIQMRCVMPKLNKALHKSA